MYQRAGSMMLMPLSLPLLLLLLLLLLEYYYSSVLLLRVLAVIDGFGESHFVTLICHCTQQ